MSQNDKQDESTASQFALTNIKQRIATLEDQNEVLANENEQIKTQLEQQQESRLPNVSRRQTLGLLGGGALLGMAGSASARSSNDNGSAGGPPFADEDHDHSGDYLGEDEPIDRIAVEQVSLTKPVVRSYMITPTNNTYQDYHIDEYDGDIMAAANAAVDDAKGGGMLIFPSGTYETSTTLDVQHGMVISGQGKLGRFEKPGTRIVYKGSGTLIDATQQGEPVNKPKIEIRDILLKGTNDPSSIAFSHNQTCKLCRVNISEFGTGQKVISDGQTRRANYTFSYDTFIFGCEVGVTGSANHWIYRDGRISRNKIGVQIDRASKFVLDGVALEANGVAVDLTSSSSVSHPAPIQVPTIENCYFEANNNDIILGNPDNGHTVRTGQIIKNRFTRTNHYDIYEQKEGDFSIRLADTTSARIGYNEFRYQNVGNIVDISANARGTWIGRNANASTATIDDNGQRTLRSGTGINDGDPSAEGQWNGHGREGATVVDTANDNVYLYRNRNWLRISASS